MSFDTTFGFLGVEPINTSFPAASSLSQVKLSYLDSTISSHARPSSTAGGFGPRALLFWGRASSLLAWNSEECMSDPDNPQEGTVVVESCLGDECYSDSSLGGMVPLAYCPLLPIPDGHG